MKRQKSLFVVLAVVSTAHLESNAQTFSGPTPYLSFADSPFSATAFDYFHLEDFSDGALDTPGVTPSGGLVVTSGNLDSVDADDGTIDGSGSTGGSLITIPATDTLTFSFNQTVLGSLPTHAGIVWTDVGNATPTTGFGNVIFEAFDPVGTSLGTVGPAPVGDGSVLGETAEDRFFGIEDTGGISSIRIMMTDSDDFEVDHLQYGRIPEPSTFALLLVGTFGGYVRGRRAGRRLEMDS